MLLALDIGNSNIVIGVSDENKWVHQWRIQTDDDKTAHEYGVLMGSLFKEVDLNYPHFSRIIIGSVVPQLTQTIRDVFRNRSNVDPLILNVDIETGIEIGRPDPAQVGADLIADSVGAYELFNDNCIVVDFGTATTIMAVEKPGRLVGGAICSGLKVTIDALVGKAAQLSQIPMEPPPKVIGTNTIESMQSGLVLGHICMIEGIIDRMRQQMGAAKVVATGGLAERIAPHTDYFDVTEPMLTLNGLRLIANRQK